jgi:DNA-binding CsgD family transcriptional regulator
LSFPLSVPPAAAQLTCAEQKIMLLALKGHDNATIAAMQGVALRTVANQMASVFRKLGVSSRVELGHWASCQVET